MSEFCHPQDFCHTKTEMNDYDGGDEFCHPQDFCHTKTIESLRSDIMIYIAVIWLLYLNAKVLIPLLPFQERMSNLIALRLLIFVVVLEMVVKKIKLEIKEETIK